MSRCPGNGLVRLALAAAAAWAAGCDGGRFQPPRLVLPWTPPPPEPAAAKLVPEPLHLLLPKTIRIEPFTGTRTFDAAGGVKGIEVRVQALDSYGDATKAFGKFNFALYPHRPDQADPKGSRIAVWEEDLLEPARNLLHWDKIHAAYNFRLQWREPIPVGSRFILMVSFSSPFTERRFAEQEFVSGQ